MKSAVYAAVAALAARNVAAHAIFQEFWIGSTDMGTQCARVPVSNSPVTSVTSNDIACNASPNAAQGKCAVVAGSTVSVEMHQQTGPSARVCGTDSAIGGAHYGPVQVYLAKVTDASTAVGSAAGWFKIFADTWAKNPAGTGGDSDFWGTNDLNSCCGRMQVKIPADIPAGDYLLRAEALALHAAGSSGGAQFYTTCYQLTISGGGSAAPATVKLPGAYSATDPGILINIHTTLTSYTAPGPAVYAGGSTKVAGSPCVGCESTCSVGSAPGTVAPAPPASTLATKPAPAPTSAPGTAPTTAPAPSGACAAMYGQCGGTGWTGATCCSAGTCKANGAYYSQCT